MDSVEGYFGEKVNLPKRMRADLLDGTVASAIMVLPMLLGHAMDTLLPDSVLSASGLGLPLGIVYVAFRDALGGGTSLGKRLIRLCLIRLEDGEPCTPRRVWTRDLLDLIPIVDLIDFVGVCTDPYGQKEMDRRLHIQLVDLSEEGDESA